MVPAFVSDFDMTSYRFYLQLILKSAVLVSMGFIALYAGMATLSSKVTIVTSFLLIFLTQAQYRRHNAKQLCSRSTAFNCHIRSICLFIFVPRRNKRFTLTICANAVKGFCINENRHHSSQYKTGRMPIFYLHHSITLSFAAPVAFCITVSFCNLSGIFSTLFTHTIQKQEGFAMYPFLPKKLRKLTAVILCTAVALAFRRLSIKCRLAAAPMARMM